VTTQCTQVTTAECNTVINCQCADWLTDSCWLTSWAAWTDDNAVIEQQFSTSLAMTSGAVVSDILCMVVSIISCCQQASAALLRVHVCLSVCVDYFSIQRYNVRQPRWAFNSFCVYWLLTLPPTHFYPSNFIYLPVPLSMVKTCGLILLKTWRYISRLHTYMLRIEVCVLNCHFPVTYQKFSESQSSAYIKINKCYCDINSCTVDWLLCIKP